MNLYDKLEKLANENLVEVETLIENLQDYLGNRKIKDIDNKTNNILLNDNEVVSVFEIV